MIGATAPCAKAIRLARQYGLRAIFVNVSFVNGDALLAALGRDAEGVVVTQVVPPFDTDLPAARNFRADLPAEQRGFVSFEGYLAADAFVEGLRRAAPRRAPMRSSTRSNPPVRSIWGSAPRSC